MEAEKPNPSKVDWHHSLSVKGILGMMMISLVLIACIIVIIHTKGKQIVLEETSRLIEATGNSAVEKLHGRSLEIAGLTRSIGTLTEQLPKDRNVFHSVLPPLLNFQGDAGIAGGGFWPEPKMFSPRVTRRSFYWGRGKNGELRYYDDYNQLGPGYHQEEWYVVVRHTETGRCFWSESYMDRYTYQAMTTCTVATYQTDETSPEKIFSGTVTVDLKLDGVHDLAESWQEQTGGYTFVLDRNNKFLSFPVEDLVKKVSRDNEGFLTEEFHHVSNLAQSQPDFAPIAQAVEAMNTDILQRAQEMSNYDASLVETLAQESYQIDQEEAKTIAAIIADPLKLETDRSKLYQKFSIDNDFFLKTPSLVFIFHVPDSYWKLVVVKPLSEATEVASELSFWLITYIGVIIIVVIGASYLLSRRLVIQPLDKTTESLKTMERLILKSHFSELKYHKLHVARSDEIGLLASVFNKLIERFITVHKELEEACQALHEQNEALERRIKSLNHKKR